MDWNAAKVALDTLALVLAIGAWLYTWRVSHHQARRAEIDELNKEMAAERGRRRHDVEELSVRLTRAETQLGHMPTRDSFHELAVSIERLAGDLRSTVSRLDGVDNIVKRIETITNRQEDFLLAMKK